MTEHYTRSTVEVSHWCAKCKKFTMHRVDQDKQQGRLGPCLECMARYDATPKLGKPEVEKQKNLFGEGM